MDAVGGELVMEFKVDESSCSLDQTFIKRVVGAAFALGQPKFLQNIVGFVVVLAVETCKIAEVVGIQAWALKIPDQSGDFGRFLAHR